LAIEDNFKISLNQNVWALVVSYAALGASEYWGLTLLRWFGFIASAGLTLSVLITFGFYTWNYCAEKIRE
jgi:hypothetical protein